MPAAVFGRRAIRWRWLSAVTRDSSKKMQKMARLANAPGSSHFLRSRSSEPILYSSENGIK
jgi:hypothetical protein